MYILFDIGGTKMRLAASRDCETFEEPVKIPTPENFDDGVAEFCKIARGLAGNEKIDGAAGGVAGPLDRGRTMLVNSPHVSGWIKKPLKAELEKKLNADVFLENDTAIVGLGEAVAGAGKGSEITVYVTVSTGVGGVRVVGGKIDKSAMGFEIGHQIIDFGGALNKGHDINSCKTCNVPGHLEGYISGKALELRFGKKPYEIFDDALWENEARLLAVGLNNTILHWSPDVVVLGGSMVVGSPGIAVEHVKKHLRQIVAIFPELPEIKKAELGDVGGIYGALAYLKQNQ